MLVYFCYNSKNVSCLKISDEYLLKDNSYGGFKNGMLYSENVIAINSRSAT